MGLPEYLPSVDIEDSIFRDAMNPRHQSSDPVTMKHNADRQRDRREVATGGSEDEIFKYALRD